MLSLLTIVFPRTTSLSCLLGTHQKTAGVLLVDCFELMQVFTVWLCLLKNCPAPDADNACSVLPYLTADLKEISQL